MWGYVVIYWVGLGLGEVVEELADGRFGGFCWEEDDVVGYFFNWLYFSISWKVLGGYYVVFLLIGEEVEDNI